MQCGLLKTECYYCVKFLLLLRSVHSFITGTHDENKEVIGCLFLRALKNLGLGLIGEGKNWRVLLKGSKERKNWEVLCISRLTRKLCGLFLHFVCLKGVVMGRIMDANLFEPKHLKYLLSNIGLQLYACDPRTKFCRKDWVTTLIDHLWIHLEEFPIFHSFDTSFIHIP